jgi:hypothetical protein
VFADSGTASYELKAATRTLGSTVVLLLGHGLLGGAVWLWALLPLWSANLWICRGLLRAFHRAGGPRLALPAFLYYFAVYPIPVAAGAVVGICEYPLKGVH